MSDKQRILAVEDEEDLQELLAFNLKKEGYLVTRALDGEQALESLRDRKPDLVLLDLMLPGIDGLEVCRRIKGEPAHRHIPIVMLTARGEESDIVVGLELGADDYIVKPFSPKVLLARVRAVLRRKAREQAGDQTAIDRHGLFIDPVRCAVKVRGKPVTLTATEFRVLHFLARNPGWVFTRQQIVDAVKGEDYPVTDRSVDVQLVGLRRKLGDCGSLVETVRGMGYRFKE